MRKPDIQHAVEASLEGRNKFLTGSGAILAYLILSIFTLPAYSSQLLGRSWFYLPEVVKMSTLGMYDTSGLVGVSLTILYALVTGITITNSYISLKAQDFSRIMDIGAFLPGVFVTGCASCGFGFLAALGFSGALATLPFGGNLIKAGGILVMAGLLHRSGDPKVCAIRDE
jgi:hypothetical protein